MLFHTAARYADAMGRLARSALKLTNIERTAEDERAYQWLVRDLGDFVGRVDESAWAKRRDAERQDRAVHNDYERLKALLRRLQKAIADERSRPRDSNADDKQPLHEQLLDLMCPAIRDDKGRLHLSGFELLMRADVLAAAKKLDADHTGKWNHSMLAQGAFRRLGLTPRAVETALANTRIIDAGKLPAKPRRPKLRRPESLASKRPRKT